MQTLNHQDGTFAARDGAELYYQAWIPERPSGNAIILLHRGHEHSGRVAELVEALALDGVPAFGFDLRGHGRSPGPRGYAEGFHQHVEDLEFFVRMIEREFGIARSNLAVVANSVTAVAAAAWVHDYAPGIRGMVLAAPAFKIKLYVPFALTGLRLLDRVKRPAYIKSYVKAKMLTHDPEQVAAYESDPLITREIAVNVLLSLRETADRLIADAATIDTPTLLLSAEKDVVVDGRAQQKFFHRLGSAHKKFVRCTGSYHALFYEQDRSCALVEARDFIQSCFLQQASGPKQAVQATTREYDALLRPSKPWKALGFAVQRLAMKGPGRMSRGVRIGLETGFDSGRSLDYVYENRARGAGPLGRLIDRGYLDTVGWDGIRTRRQHLRDVLRNEIESRPEGVELIDLATGCGRYVLETLAELPDAPVHAVLRDWTEANLEQGRAHAEALKLSKVQFERADAFDEQGLRSLSGVDIAIVSGLYELFPDNELIERSLRGLAAAVKEGGTLVYTCQPWHPQIEMIARTLNNRDGEPWIMRRRSQAEMDALVSAAGFEKVDMRIDEHGIFTVSVARRKAHAARVVAA